MDEKIETSVAKALKNAQPTSLYDWRGILYQTDLTYLEPTGEAITYIMGQIEKYDLKVFADELDAALYFQSPRARTLFTRHAEMLANLIRVVNYNTRAGFKGVTGNGMQLDAIFPQARLHQDPDVSYAQKRTSWIRPIANPCTLQFICGSDDLGANNHQPLTMTPYEGYALLGFANTAASPCTSEVQIQYRRLNTNMQSLDFALAEYAEGHILCDKTIDLRFNINTNNDDKNSPDWTGEAKLLNDLMNLLASKGVNISYQSIPLYDPIIALKEPLVIYPGENALVNVHYYKNGVDELRPIGLWVKTSNELRMKEIP